MFLSVMLLILVISMCQTQHMICYISCYKKLGLGFMVKNLGLEFMVEFRVTVYVSILSLDHLFDSIVELISFY